MEGIKNEREYIEINIAISEAEKNLLKVIKLHGNKTVREACIKYLEAKKRKLEMDVMVNFSHFIELTKYDVISPKFPDDRIG